MVIVHFFFTHGYVFLNRHPSCQPLVFMARSFGINQGRMWRRKQIFDWSKGIKDALKAEVVMFDQNIRIGKNVWNRNIVGTRAESKYINVFIFVE